MTIEVGMRLGKYELKRELGKGGFGVVFIARDSQLGRDCALKFLLPEHTSTPELLQRFLQEARTAAQIGHLGIVTVYECGQIEGTNTRADGMAFIAMELLQGEALSERLNRARALEPALAIEIARQIAAALGAAHKAGVVHRDLKPDNVFLVPDRVAAIGERVKVLDFGIAKLADPSGGDSGIKTRAHVIFGTPRYMSPEQCRSTANVDGRTDIYALGVMLFEMLCGEPPFAGDAGALIALHQMAPPPLVRSKRPGLSEQIEALVSAMLAKEPGDRPSSMEDVIRRLDGLATAPMLETPAPAPMSPPVAGGIAPTLPASASDPKVFAAVAKPTNPEPYSKPAITSEPPRPARRWPWLAGLGLAAGGSLVAYVATRGGSAQHENPVVTHDAGTTAIDAAVTVAPKPPIAPEGMSYIPAADIAMGSTEKEIDATFEWCKTLTKPTDCRREIYERERPVRKVHVSAFFLDREERTNRELAEWLERPEVHRTLDPGRVMIENHLIAEITDPRVAPTNEVRPLTRTKTHHVTVLPGYEDKPAIFVTHYGARAFCESRQRTLPTEVQWERAARGATGRRFPWGDELPSCNLAVFGRLGLTDRKQRGSCPGESPDPIGGGSDGDVTRELVRHLGGNVSEWVLDRFVAPYPECPAPCVDPVATPPDTGGVHVIRGGTYNGLAEQLRSAGRARATGDDVQGNVGFRCAAPIPKGSP